jgi:hypothetical protein
MNQTEDDYLIYDVMMNHYGMAKNNKTAKLIPFH